MGVYGVSTYGSGNYGGDLEQLVLIGEYEPETKWKLYLALSPYINIGATKSPPAIAELVYAKDISIDLIHNRPGALRFSTQLDDDRAGLIVPVNTCIVAVRDGIVRWSGPVWTVDQDIASGRVQVGAVGWLDLLERRKIRVIMSRTAETDDVRTQAIFSALSAQVDTGNNTIPMPLTYGGHVGVTRDRSAQIFQRGDPIGSIINQLISIEGGYDIRVNPTTRVLTTHRSIVVGSVLGYGVNRPDVLFSYGLGSDNLQGITQQADASTLANVINAVGPGGLVVQTDDYSSISAYGAFEDDFSMTDAGISEDTLRAGAVAEVFFRKQPRVTWQIVPFPWTSGGNVPRLFDDYDVGDVVRLAARRSWLTIPANLDVGGTQSVRIYGASISIDENGNERISSLQLAPS